MKILVLTGSPNKCGTSNTLVAAFKKGAEESGHSVEIFDCAKENIHPCLGCGACHMHSDCVQKDEGNNLVAKVLGCDVVVFATPVYYFGMSAQLKMAIDRFYCHNGAITRKNLKSILIATAWNSDVEVMSALVKHFDKIFDYLHMQKIGQLLGVDSGLVQNMPKSHIKNAYDLGKGLSCNSNKQY